MEVEASPITGSLIEDFAQDELKFIVETFGSDVSRSIKILRATAAVGDTTAFCRAAHMLVGCASAVGARSLERSVRAAMEEAQTPTNCLAALARIHTEACQALTALMVLTEGTAARRRQ